MDVPVLSIVWGWKKAEVLFTCIKLGVFDLLVDSPKDAAHLVELSSYHQDNLTRLLRNAAALQLLDYDATTEKYSLNDISKSVAGEDGLKSVVELHLNETAKRAYGQLPAAVRDGTYPFKLANGAGLFDYLQQHADEQKSFNDAMSAMATDKKYFGEGLEKVYPLTVYKKLVDVGGGYGTLLAQLLRTNPHATGIVFDMADVVEAGIGKKETEYSDVKDRLDFVGGDFFTSVPSGGDAYILKMVIHDWKDDKALLILQNIHKAMPDNAKLVVLDKVVDYADASFTYTTTMDIHMMVTTDGKERSAKEFEELYDRAGFKLTNIFRIPNSPCSVVEGVKK